MIYHLTKYNYTFPGAALLGLQLELDNFKCKNEQLIEDSIESKSVERTVISTYGSFIAESLAEWSKQVISLVQASSFSPRYLCKYIMIIHIRFNFCRDYNCQIHRNSNFIIIEQLEENSSLI